MSEPPPPPGVPDPHQQPPAWPYPNPHMAWPNQYPVQYVVPQGWWPGAYFDPNDPLISPDYAGWWRRTWAIVRARWRTLVALQAISLGTLIVTLAVVLGVMFGVLGTAVGTEADAPAASPAQIGTVIGVVFAGVLLALLVSYLVQLAATHVVVSAAAGAPVSVAGSLRAALRRLLPLLGWGSLGALIVMGGVCACFFPAIYFGAVLYVLPVVVMVERGGVIGRCFSLFNRNLGVSVSRVATVYGVGMAAGFLTMPVQFFASALIGPNPSTAATLVAMVITMGAQVAVTTAAAVFTGPAQVTMYADMRARVEPVSTAVIAGQLLTD